MAEREDAAGAAERLSAEATAALARELAPAPLPAARGVR